MKIQTLFIQVKYSYSSSCPTMQHQSFEDFAYWPFFWDTIHVCVQGFQVLTEVDLIWHLTSTRDYSILDYLLQVRLQLCDVYIQLKVMILEIFTFDGYVITSMKAFNKDTQSTVRNFTHTYTVNLTLTCLFPSNLNRTHQEVLWIVNSSNESAVTKQLMQQQLFIQLLVALFQCCDIICYMCVKHEWNIHQVLNSSVSMQKVNNNTYIDIANSSSMSGVVLHTVNTSTIGFLIYFLQWPNGSKD